MSGWDEALDAARAGVVSAGQGRLMGFQVQHQTHTGQVCSPLTLVLGDSAVSIGQEQTKNTQGRQICSL